MIGYDPTLGGCGVTVVAVVVQVIGGCVIPSDASVSPLTRPVPRRLNVLGIGVLYGSVDSSGVIVRTAGLTVNVPFV